MFSIKIKCPHCIHTINLPIQRITEYSSREPVALNDVNGRPRAAVRMLTASHPVTAYSTEMCPECHGPVMLVFKCDYSELQKVQQSANDINWVMTGPGPQIIATYPSLKEPDDSPHYPEKIRKIFVELQEDVQMKRTAPRIVVGCRSVLEVALRTLGYDKGNLLSRIEQARTDGVLTESMKNWAHRIRIDGNEAVHELEATDNEAAEFVSFIKFFLELSFVLPLRVNDAQDKK